MTKQRRFELVMTGQDFDQLESLAEMYTMSMSAVVRLAVGELYHKVQNTTARSPVGQHPILQPKTDAPPPPEMDPFWRDFRS